MRTIQSVIDTIMECIPDGPLDKTVDTIKAGDPLQPVTGIVTTFIASIDVIKKAAQTGSNLIITHEPTYYNGPDEVEWLERDSIFQDKSHLIKSNSITIWRFHDHWHMLKPDGIMTGMVKEFNWREYQDSNNQLIFNLPTVRLSELIAHIKQKSNIGSIRFVGDPGSICSRIAMIPGAIGGINQIKFLQENDVDVLICGETTEWETVEYIRDALAQGHNKSLVVLGHANSEEAGMKYLVEWLQPKLPEVPIRFIPAGDPFKYL